MYLLIISAIINGIVKTLKKYFYRAGLSKHYFHSNKHSYALDECIMRSRKNRTMENSSFSAFQRTLETYVSVTKRIRVDDYSVPVFLVSVSSFWSRGILNFRGI